MEPRAFWPNLSLRQAERGEGEHLAGLAFEAWHKDLRPFLSGEAANPRTERQRLRGVITALIDRIIVAESRGVVLGFGMRARSRAYIPYLFVAPEAQNHGIGTLILTRIESLYELEGFDRVSLDTLSDNVRAVRFYQHHGYRILAMKRDGHGAEPDTSVRLEKPLFPFKGIFSTSEDGT